MKDNYSIDELVREKLAEGQEQHNLGAWANMERMLDGKNPYAKPEKDNDRKWLPFLLLFIVVGSGVAVALNSFQNTDGKAPAKVVNTNQKQALSQAIASADNQLYSDAANTAAAVINETNDPQQQQAIIPNNTNNIASNSTIKNNSNRISPIKNKTKTNSNLGITKTTNFSKKATESKRTTENSIASIVDNKNNNKSPKQNKQGDNTAKLAAAVSSDMPESNEKEIAIDNAIKAKQEVVTASANTEATLSTKQIDVPAVRVEEKMVTDLNGNKTIVFDTTEFSVKMNVPVEKTNPRYVKLSEKAQQRAETKTGIVSNTLQELQVENNMVASAVPMPQKKRAPIKTDVASSAVIKEDNTNEKLSFFARFKNMSKQLYQKANTATIRIADKQIAIYPGMIVGVNASMFSKHNFGGFQGGLTALTPLNRFLSLSTEARFIHRNNSAYTVNDYNYTIKNMSIDSNSLSSSKIYNYQVDSNALGYNFKNFYTIQMPILLNAHLKDFTFYGGLNMAYGFRMDVRTSNKAYVVNAADTIATNSVYNQRANIGKRFTNNDFNSRFGLGYTVGGSYSFNPNLYLDLRFSNVLWDNAKTEAKQEISSDFFRIPAIQFSLGYRFRKFDKRE